MIKFEKVSYEQFLKDYKAIYGDEIEEKYIKPMYDNLKLPKRATSGSCGYDFFSPFDWELDNRSEVIVGDKTCGYEPRPTEIMIPTGIRAIMDENVCLVLVPRSGLGSKHYLRLSGTLGVIDSDYYKSDNEGHIFIKVRIENHNLDVFRVVAGERFAQGIFLNYLRVDNDRPIRSTRNGGFGSTDKVTQ